LLRSR